MAHTGPIDREKVKPTRSCKQSVVVKARTRSQLTRVQMIIEMARILATGSRLMN